MRGARCVLRRAEYDITPDGIGERTNAARRPCGTDVSMYSNLAEIMAEALLHENAGWCIEGSSGRTKGLVHNWRGVAGASASFDLFGLQRTGVVLLLARGACAAQLHGRSADRRRYRR